MNEFLKTRVESIGLERRITDALLLQHIRTVGGIVAHDKEELKGLLGLSDQDIELLFEKTTSVVEIERQAETEKMGFLPIQPTKEDRNPIRTPDLGEKDIVGMLSNYFGLEKKLVEKHTRRQEVVRVRHWIIYLLHEYGDMSYTGIGRLLDRDHTTVIHAYQKVKRDVQADPELETTFAAVIGKMNELKERKQRIQEVLTPEVFHSTTQEIPGYKERPVFREIPERNIKILELYREGLTLENIGTVVGVTRERVRQVVIRTIHQMAENESLEKGIVMDSGVLIEEESRKRKMVQELRQAPKKQDLPPSEHRWSKYYTACRSCSTTAIPHVKKGLCEQCAGRFRAERREDIIDRHNNKCDSCGRNRYEATALFGRDLYITKDKVVLCGGCFRKHSGKMLGGYKNYEWSRHYERCLKCGTTETPHMKKGLCESCSDVLTDERREKIISEKGSRCGHCGMVRTEVQKKYQKDLFVIRTGKTLCRVCFQKYAKFSMRAAKGNKKAAML